MSDLIERYGYERAVRELKAMDDRAIWMISSCLKYREEVRKECLEYRREHNIFEVGDKVKAKDHQFGFDELFRVDEFFANDDGINLAVLDDGDCYPISFLEHATPEEIKVGHRL